MMIMAVRRLGHLAREQQNRNTDTVLDRYGRGSENQISHELMTVRAHRHQVGFFFAESNERFSLTGSPQASSASAGMPAVINSA